MNAHTARSGLLAVCLLLASAGCRASAEAPDLLQVVDDVYVETIAAGDLEQGVIRLENVLPDTLGAPGTELLVEYYLTRAHLLASLRQPFLKEPAFGLARSLRGGESTRESVPAHLVALVYHASAAQALLHKHSGGEDRRLVQGNLRLSVATAMARLGFHEDAARAADEDPELRAVETIPELLERYDLPEDLESWLAVLGFESQRSSDERAAYRLALHAIEGDQRGLPLPAVEVERLESWILEGASVRFVCPESGTPYVPGMTRSLRSGVPHREYVAVERP